MSYLDPLLEKKDDETIDQAIDRYNKLKGPGVYQIRVVNDDTFYIGASTRTKTRLETHLRELKDNKHHNKKLQESYNNSSDKVLEISIFTTNNSDNAFAVEKDLIEKNKKHKNCANKINSCTPSCLGKTVSEETKKKISEHNKKYFQNPDNIFNKGKKLSEITKRLVGLSSKERWKNKDYKENIIQKNIERFKDPVNREKSRQATLKVMENVEYKNKIIENGKKQFTNHDFRERNRLATIERFKNSNFKEQHRQKIADLWKTEEYRNKMLNRRCKEITIDGVTYKSTKEAVRSAGDSKVRKQRKLEKEFLNHG